MQQRETPIIFSAPRAKPRVRVLVSLKTGRMAVREPDGSWRMLWWQDG